MGAAAYLGRTFVMLAAFMIPTLAPQAGHADAGGALTRSSVTHGYMSQPQNCYGWRWLRFAETRYLSLSETLSESNHELQAAFGCAPLNGRSAVVVDVSRFGMPTVQDSRCAVLRIIDGDTIRCTDGRRIRLLLIDAPEMDQEPFGMQARSAVERLASVGSMLALEFDVGRLDRFGRTLAYAYLPDGRMLNEELLRAGMAVVSVYPPNVKHIDRLRGVADSARAAARGLWSLAAFSCLPTDRRAGRCLANSDALGKDAFNAPTRRRSAARTADRCLSARNPVAPERLSPPAGTKAITSRP